MKKLIKICLTGMGAALLFSSCTHRQQEYANKQASILNLGSLPENPLLLTPMATLTNRSNNTMSMLYGNSIAVQHARQQGTDMDPPGSLLYKVTWQAKPDSLWFGATIPKQVRLVERVMVNNRAMPVYTAYKGSALAQTKGREEDAGTTAENILQLKMAVSP